MSTVEAVKCDVCGTLHELESETYYTVHGNITIGMNGGLVGNNIDEDSKVIGTSIYCKPECMAKVLSITTPYR